MSAASSAPVVYWDTELETCGCQCPDAIEDRLATNMIQLVLRKLFTCARRPSDAALSFEKQGLPMRRACTHTASAHTVITEGGCAPPAQGVLLSDDAACKLRALDSPLAACVLSPSSGRTKALRQPWATRCTRRASACHAAARHHPSEPTMLACMRFDAPWRGEPATASTGQPLCLRVRTQLACAGVRANADHSTGMADG
eukprot:7376583-Prymnesium_polylepis.1